LLSRLQRKDRMETKSPTIAKVTRPIPTGVYVRKRLFDLLDRKRKYPVIWVSSPPGCGKTTMVTSYLENKETPCLWYQADEGDADPATFFYYLGLAAKKATPRKRKPLPLLTPEYLPGLPIFTLRYFENLFHRLKAPSFLVFDNYQEVPVESPFHDVIRHGLSNIPEGINVILISRSDPPPVLIHMQANNLMGMIGWQDLRLTLKESINIVNLQARRGVLPEAVEHLHTATDGWLAGLMLMLKTAEIENIDPRNLGKVPKNRIFDYFTGEIFNKTDEKSQKFLLKTAFLPKMTASMAEALTGLDSASRILYWLNRNHCFTEMRFQNSPAYEYHPLFREFLLSRANETFSPETLLNLRQHAAMLLEEADQTEAAIMLLRDAGDWDRLVRLILKHAPAMLGQGRNRSLEQWLSTLPKEIFESTPWIAYWMGECKLFFDPSSAGKYFEQAFERFKRQEDAAGMFLAWSGIVSSIVYASENFKPLDRWIDTFEKLVERFGTFPSKEIEIRAASSMFMALTTRQPSHPEVEAWAQRGILLGNDRATLNEKAQTLGYLLRYQMFAGDLEKATLTLETLKQLPLSRYASHLSQILAKLAEALYWNVTRSFEKCQSTVSEGLELSRKTGVHVYDFMLLGLAVLSAQELNDMSTAGNILEQMDSSLNSLSTWDSCFYHLLKARDALIQKNPKKAYYHADLGVKLNSKVGSPTTMEIAYLIKAYVLIELGEYHQAAEQITEVFRSASENKSTLFQSYALFLEAQSALDRGNETSGLKSLRTALAYENGCGYLFIFIDIRSKTIELYAKALEAGIEVDLVQDIIRKRKIVPDDPPLHLENWPWAIQIFTLGRFKITIDGKPFNFPKKVQKKPLEMLKILISFGERQEISKAQLSDILWPESDGDKAEQAFYITLHRLRQLLGHDKAIGLREGKLTLDLRYCWVDSMAFERMLKRAEHYAEKGERNCVIQSLERAAALYKGPFLSGDADEPWAISYSERLRTKFLRAIEKLGSHLAEEGELDRAVECFNRAIEMDDIIEIFYQRLMICLKKLGRRTEALSVYNRCKKTLLYKLRLEPTKQTEKIKQSLFDE